MPTDFESGVRPDASTVASETFATPIEPAAPLTREAIAEKFPQLEILELLGRGGMGVVYKARQPQLDRLVALKILPAEIARTPGFAERFAREARALARLSHPHIVTIHDSGQASGLYYFIMEYVDGANLRQLIADKKLSPETALAIVPKICEALQFAHEEGILHRDIKPENILLDKKGRVKIADFGLAKLTGADDVDHGLTHTGAAMGTPRYMAPEQFNDTKGVDHRADIYSLGVVFYEMLTGQLPIGRFPLPSKTLHVDVRLDEVVLRTLEQEPALRYQHASEVKADIDHITSSAHAASPAQPVGGAPGPFTQQDRLDELVRRRWPDRFAAVKAYREATGADLATTKAAVESIAQRLELDAVKPERSPHPVSPFAFAALLVAGLLIGCPFLSKSSLIGHGSIVWWTVGGIVFASLGIPLFFAWRRSRRRVLEDTGIRLRWVALVISLLGSAACFFPKWNQVYMDTRKVGFAPKSGAFEQLTLQVDSIGDYRGSASQRHSFARYPVRMQMEIVHREGVVDRIWIDLPGLAATWLPRAGQNLAKGPSQGGRSAAIGLTPEIMFNWLRTEAGLALDDARIQEEAGEINTFLGNWKTRRPENWHQVFESAQAAFTHYGHAKLLPGMRTHAGMLPLPVFANLLLLSVGLFWLSGVGRRGYHLCPPSRPGSMAETPDAVQSGDASILPTAASLHGKDRRASSPWRIALCVAATLFIAAWTQLFVRSPGAMSGQAVITEDEARDVANDMEKRAKTFRRLPDGAVPAFANVKHRDGWTYTLFARVLREPGSPHPPTYPGAQLPVETPVERLGVPAPKPVAAGKPWNESLRVTRGTGGRTRRGGRLRAGLPLAGVGHAGRERDDAALV